MSRVLANTSSDSINQMPHGDASVSPSSYSSLLGGSRINLANTVIRGTCCSPPLSVLTFIAQRNLQTPRLRRSVASFNGAAAAVPHRSPHHAHTHRALSTDDASRSFHASMPHVASAGRLSEKRSSIDEQDVFGALGELEIGGASTSSGAGPHAPPSAAPAVSTAAPPRLGDIPLGQLSRTLYVRGVDPSVGDEDLFSVFEVRRTHRTICVSTTHYPCYRGSGKSRRSLPCTSSTALWSYPTTTSVPRALQ